MSDDRHDDPSPIGETDARSAAMPEVLAAVEQAVHRRRASPARRHRRRAVRGAGLGTVLALASGTALAATGHWDPFWDGHHDPESFVLTAPPELQSASLAVLRRTQDNRDRSQLLSAFLGRMASEGRIRLPSVRYLRTLSPMPYTDAQGRTVGEDRRQIFVLIPRDVRGIERPQAGSRKPVFNTYAPRGSAEEAGRNWLCAWTVEDNWPDGASTPTQSFTPPGDALPPRPARLEDRVTGGGGCATIQQIRIKGLMSGSFATGVLIGLVPDGVVSVRATTVAGKTFTAKVENNSFELLAPDRVKAPPLTGVGLPVRSGRSGRFKHGSLEWLDARGVVIRHIAQ